MADWQEEAEIILHNAFQGICLKGFFFATYEAVHGPADVYHLVEGEEEPGCVADAEHEHDAHEDDGQVVLLLPPHRRLRLRRRAVVVALSHRQLPLVPVLHVLVDLQGGGKGGSKFS